MKHLDILALLQQLSAQPGEKKKETSEYNSITTDDIRAPAETTVLTHMHAQHTPR